VNKPDIQFWNEWWIAQRSIARAIPRPKSASYRGRFHKFFYELFSPMNVEGTKLIEAGCGNSLWLPYFARVFRFAVTGIDYSQTGSEQARRNLSESGASGEIVCADFFDPPPALRGNFDVVFSAGVVEHYADTASCVSALTALLKPGGLIVTSIPNMHGTIGVIQRHINKPFFEIHNPLDKLGLAQAHERVGLEVLQCEYFMSINFGVLSLTGGQDQWLVRQAKAGLIGGLMLATYLVWLLEEATGPLGSNALTSPYINCVARKPSVR
jgi:2-polyprenyl-3-methyl-5-hydroxy-6-metoxy-1,4-benzoquinol methylase